MTQERFDDIDKRTKRVEEAIIKFEYIADTVLTKHEKRIENCENEIDNLKISIYQACDTKTTEVDKKIADTKSTILKIILAFAGLGLSAVIFFANAHRELQSDVTSIDTKMDMLLDERRGK